MRHEIIQLNNLLRHTPKYTLAELGIPFHPTFRIDEKIELANHVNARLPSAKLNMPVATVFQIKDLELLTSLSGMFCIAGKPKIGNCLMWVNKKLYGYEQSIYKQYPNHLDVIRSLDFSSNMSDNLRGLIGRVYGLYKKQVQTYIDEQIYIDVLQEISFLDYLHELMITNDIPVLLKELG